MKSAKAIWFTLAAMPLLAMSVTTLPAHAVQTAPDAIRIATYNVSLYGDAEGEVKERLSDGRDAQAESIAAVVQTIRPDVLLVNEIDYDEDSATARLLADKFFASACKDRKPIYYPHVIAFPSNTGIDSGLDLNQNDVKGEPNDAWGYGVYPGQYAMAVFSRFPIDKDEIRTFQMFRWAELPNASRPVNPDTGEAYHEDRVWNQLRLSSKNHIDAPIQIGTTLLHLLASHPTPPVFDGPEDLNGRRNYDEIRFWIDYLKGEEANYLVDDHGRPGGLQPGALFVVAGDLNADPHRGDGRTEAIRTLLTHPRVQDPLPAQWAISEEKLPEDDAAEAVATVEFGSNGKLRVDYVLPSRELSVREAGVFWPPAGEPGHDWIQASDHRLVWLELSGWKTPSTGEEAGAQ